jgi:esterase/lipase
MYNKKVLVLLWTTVFLLSNVFLNAYAAENKVGVVLLHGKGGMPATPPILELASDLKRNGFMVITPEMSYSKFRRYDKTYEETMLEIDKALEQLKGSGAKKIFVAGHSLGANVVLYYATQASVDGIIMIAPGHRLEDKKFQDRLGDSLDRAKKMVDEGKGSERSDFTDVNQGNTSIINVTAKIYLSWFSPEGAAVMPRNAPAVKPEIAVLYVVGKQDPIYEKGRQYVFDKLPQNPDNKYLVVNSDHMRTPVVAANEIIAWLNIFKNR